MPAHRVGGNCWNFDVASRLPNPLLQAGAVPYRWEGGRAAFCLITTSDGQRWGFPKGMIDPGETPEETALKETEEEAGLTGRLTEEPLGVYEYSKWGTRLVVTVYLMEVTSEVDHWEESALRERRWLPADEALALLDRPPLRHLLTTARERLEA